MRRATLWLGWLVTRSPRAVTSPVAAVLDKWECVRCELWVSFYRDRVWPRLLDVAMSPKRTGKTRARVCAGLAGHVVEIGFGTGHNLPYLPAEVTSLRVVEPSGLGVRLAGARIVASTVPVEVTGLGGQAQRNFSVRAVHSRFRCPQSDRGA